MTLVPLFLIHKDSRIYWASESHSICSTRLKEHKKEAERLASKSKNFTRQARMQSLGEQRKSTIVDHAPQYNHVIDWDGAKVLQMECD